MSAFAERTGTRISAVLALLTLPVLAPVALYVLRNDRDPVCRSLRRLAAALASEALDALRTGTWGGRPWDNDRTTTTKRRTRK